MRAHTQVPGIGVVRYWTPSVAQQSALRWPASILQRKKSISGHWDGWLSYGKRKETGRTTLAQLRKDRGWGRKNMLKPQGQVTYRQPITLTLTSGQAKASLFEQPIINECGQARRVKKLPEKWKTLLLLCVCMGVTSGYLVGPGIQLLTVRVAVVRIIRGGPGQTYAPLPAITHGGVPCYLTTTRRV